MSPANPVPQGKNVNWLWRLGDVISLPLGIAFIVLLLPAGLGFFLLFDWASALMAMGRLGKTRLAIGAGVWGFILVRTYLHSRRGPQAASGPDHAGNSPDILVRAAKRLSLPNITSTIDRSKFLPLAILWAVWLGWVSLWWNRAFYPFDMGREPTIAWMWLNNVRPYVDHYMTHHTLGGVILFKGLISIFGFVPYIWNLIFVLWFGFILSLIYLLLRRVITPSGALVITAVTVPFVNIAEFLPYFMYYWQGLLMALLAVYFFSRIFSASRPLTTHCLAAACSFFSVLTICFIPQYGIVLVISFIVTISALKLTSPRNITVMPWCITLLASYLFLVGCVMLGMHQLGILSGYYGWIKSLRNVTTDQFGTGGLGQTLTNWTYAVSLVKGSYFSRYSTAALAFLAGIWFLRGIKNTNRDYYYARFKLIYYLSSAVVILWLLLDTRQALTCFDKIYKAISICPPFTIILSAVMGYELVKCLGKGSKKDRQDGLHWLVLLLTGAGLYFSIVQTHRTLGYALAMSLVYTPVVLAYAWFRLPVLWGFTWPRGAAILLVLVMAGLGISQKVLHFPYGGSWYQRWDYFNYPALRHLRAPYAAEMDQVLFMARDVVDQGGKVLVYPRQITLYALLGVMPPLPFPDLDYRLYCYPKDPALWQAALAKIDDLPPELIIVERRNFTRQKWSSLRTEEPRIPQVVREVYDDHFGLAPSRRYQRVLDGATYLVYRWKG